MADRKAEKKTGPPLVFISHDTKDAEIAKKFGELLNKVSVGVLKYFLSSDLISGHGIEYGADWYETLIQKLKQAGDIACLLTENSLNRPWILFEAGVAHGKLDKTLIHGIAIGIDKSKLTNTPFARVQNCGDEEDALTGLIMQMVARVPHSEPKEEAIREHVRAFRKDVAEILQAKRETVNGEDKSQEISPFKLFEEIKSMQNILSRDVQQNNKLIEQLLINNSFLPYEIDEKNKKKKEIAKLIVKKRAVAKGKGSKKK